MTARPVLCGVCGLAMVASPAGIRACTQCDAVDRWPSTADAIADTLHRMQADGFGDPDPRRDHPSGG